MYKAHAHDRFNYDGSNSNPALVWLKKLDDTCILYCHHTPSAPAPQKAAWSAMVYLAKKHISTQTARLFSSIVRIYGVFCWESLHWSSNVSIPLKRTRKYITLVSLFFSQYFFPICFVRSWMYCWTMNTFIGRWWQIKRNGDHIFTVTKAKQSSIMICDLWPWMYGMLSAVLWCGHWTLDVILYSWPLTLHCYLRLKEGISISIYYLLSQLY